MDFWRREKVFVRRRICADNPAMANVASWVREGDEGHFRRFFDARPEMRLCNARTEDVDVKSMDGLLITGGEDISAEFLNQEVPDPSLIHEPQPERDAWEFEALQFALEGGKPVFAICKGHQVLNVALGGTLRLDIAGHALPELKTQNLQPLRYAAGVEERRRFALVNNSHHQVIDKPGDGLEVEAWCAADDVIEQVRIRNYPFGLGVQYHPERDLLYKSLFEDFFDHVLKK
jgi:putative glutamine amidotransferase